MADGRWDEAADMLTAEELREFLPAKQLSRDLAGRLVERAQQRIANGQSQAGWRDLTQAARLGARESQIGLVRSRQIEDRMSRVIDGIARGDLEGAKQELARMADRNLNGRLVRTWEVVILALRRAEQRGAKGDSGAAIHEAERALALLPAEGCDAVAAHINMRLDHWRAAASRLPELDAQLHAALAASRWSEALAAADALLELAPEHSAARQARRRAWNAVGLAVTEAHYPAPKGGIARSPLKLGGLLPAGSTRRRRDAQGDTVRENGGGAKRLVAWIDAVGGYLVCLGDEIVIGQPGEPGVHVPIVADLSRRHAIIRREGEAYVLTPIQKTAVDGHTISEPTVLRDKSLIKLGASVEVEFRKPHALSNTASLRIVSRHRTDPAVDGVILMSESCILGPNAHSHIQCRDWTGDLVLFRRGEELMCRSTAPVTIDGVTCAGQAAVSGRCRIECDNFAMSLEEV